MNQRPVGGCCSETSSHPFNMNNNSEKTRPFRKHFLTKTTMLKHMTASNASDFWNSHYYSSCSNLINRSLGSHSDSFWWAHNVKFGCAIYCPSYGNHTARLRWRNTKETTSCLHIEHLSSAVGHLTCVRNTFHYNTDQLRLLWLSPLHMATLTMIKFTPGTAYGVKFILNREIYREKSSTNYNSVTYFS
jgi:hypothetical protein